MPNEFYHFQVRGPEITSEQRLGMYENWLLAKGFQDLARGVRESLEEAALYLALISDPSKRVSTSNSLDDLIDSMRKPGSRLGFPELLDRVNSGLTSPIEFKSEFSSIQRVRNCLEHRGGIVRKEDLDKGGPALSLTFPRWKLFYMRGSEEIELAPGERVDDGTGQPDVQILGRLVARSKTYELGERVTFSFRDFSEIAAACSFLGQQIAARLPLA